MQCQRIYKGECPHPLKFVKAKILRYFHKVQRIAMNVERYFIIIVFYINAYLEKIKPTERQ